MLPLITNSRGTDVHYWALQRAGPKRFGPTEVTLTTFRDLPFNGGFYASAGFVVLEANEIPQRLAAILAEEAEHGLDLRERSAMVLSSNSARRALFAIL